MGSLLRIQISNMAFLLIMTASFPVFQICFAESGSNPNQDSSFNGKKIPQIYNRNTSDQKHLKGTSNLQEDFPNFQGVLQNILFFYFFILLLFFGGLKCVGHSFAYVAYFVFFKDVMIRTQRAAVASRCATNLATYLSTQPPIFLIFTQPPISHLKTCMISSFFLFL